MNLPRSLKEPPWWWWKFTDLQNSARKYYLFCLFSQNVFTLEWMTYLLQYQHYLFSSQNIFHQIILDRDANIWCHQYPFEMIRPENLSFRKGKPADVCNFMNNVESIFDHLIRRNRCYRVDAKYEWLITSGAAEKVNKAKWLLDAACVCMRQSMRRLEFWVSYWHTLKPETLPRLINHEVNIRLGAIDAFPLSLSNFNYTDDQWDGDKNTFIIDLSGLNDLNNDIWLSQDWPK